MNDNWPPSRKEAIDSGARYYFTGKPCINGHLSKRDTKSRICYECSQSRWLEASRKKRADEDYAERERRRNREAMARKLRENPDWRQRKNESNKEYARRVRKESPHKAAVARHKRRALEAGSAGVFTEDDVAAINKAQSYICVYCDASTKASHHVDHRTPLSRGGDNWPENIQILCPHCNVSKKDKTHEEFVSWLAELRPANDNSHANIRDSA